MIKEIQEIKIQLELLLKRIQDLEFRLYTEDQKLWGYDANGSPVSHEI